MIVREYSVAALRIRYERASTVLTANKGFEEWIQILGDEVVAAALLNQVLHGCHIVNIRGNSYRLRRHAELSKAMHPTASRAVTAQNSGAERTGTRGDQVRPQEPPGHYAPFTRTPAMCAIFDGQKCAVFNGH